MILGLGTGRCGTTSLARLLDSQPGARCTHERYRFHVPWGQGKEWADKLVCEGGGDCAFYWLPMLGYLWEQVPDMRVICLRRDREDTIDSYMSWTEGRNHWMAHSGNRWDEGRWDQCYPTYKVSSKRKALGRYWDHYYRWAEMVAAARPDRFRIFETEALNTEAGQREILSFAGVDKSDQHLRVGIRENQQTYGDR